MESRLTANPLFTSPDLERIYNEYQAKVDLQTKIKGHKKKIQAANSVMQLDELKNRKRVLRRLGFTSSNDVIEMKGRYGIYPHVFIRPLARQTLLHFTGWSLTIVLLVRSAQRTNSY
jgi:superfamily II RNA helicase